jgi:serine phosphatase RsbU (regulator of sigma subunit)
MLGDAVGHGVPAALVTAVAFSVSRSIDMELEAAQANPVSPSRFLKSINDILCEMNSKLACMTFLIFRIHEESGETVFSNAGNLQPVLIPKSEQDQRLAKSQRLKTLLARGDVLGLGRDLDVEEHRMTLKSGDKIALYTDGLIENQSPKSKEPLGKKWLKDIMTGAASKGSSQFCDHIWASYSHEVGASKVADDVTLVVIERP